MCKEEWILKECNGQDIHEYSVSLDTDGSQGWLIQPQRSSLQRFVRLSHLVNWLKDVFLPQGFPNTVSADYIHYQIWDTLQAYCSSVAGAVSLHATLGSLGVGQAGTTALAATLTWLTNTGTGMVAAITFTYYKGSQLDSNNKQWRLFADVINDMGHLVKLSTPLLPLPPVVPLTFAAVLYALVGVTGGATRTALTAHQARNSNLADVAAKDGSQETLVNLAALLTSLVMLPLITHSLGLTWSVFLVLLVCHLYCNYRAVRAVVCPSLNRPRLLLLLQSYNVSRTMPTVEEANKEEPLLTGPAFCPNYLCQGWSLELGCSLQRALSLTTAPLRTKPVITDNCMLLSNSSTGRVFAVMAAAASNRDVLRACWTAFLYAQLASKAQESSSNWSSEEGWDRISEKASESFPLLIENMQKKGWAVDELFLDVGEWRILEHSG